MKIRWKKFLSYYRPYLPLFARVMVCAVIVAGITLVVPLIIRAITKLVTAGNQPGLFEQIAWLGALMLALIAVQTICYYYVDYHGHAMGAMMERDLRGELFAHFQKLSFSFFDGQRTGQLMSRLTNDLLNLAELYHHGPEDYLIYLVKFVGTLAILLSINPSLTLVILFFLPVLAIFSYFFNIRMNAAYRNNRQRIGEVNARVEDNLNGIRVVKSFANEELERRRFGEENDRFLESRKAIYRNEAYLYDGVSLITQLITLTVIVVGAAAIARASLDAADLITFLLYTGSLIEPIQKLTHMTEQFQEGISGFERFMEIIELAPEIQDAPNAVDPGEVRGDVSFRDVSFRYHADHDAILEHIDLEVKSGETVALVGSSGAGKTTMLSLIPRFYEVSEGEILLDGINIKNIRLETLRRHVGVVQQEVYLFAGTVMDNIRYGKPEASDEEIMAAARLANAHDFIQELPQGYNTDVGQRGVRLSGGQKQRISIARVFLKNPAVLIFDEATSALDQESEDVVQESLEALAKDRTTFIIAHRLSTIRTAGRIVVLSDRGIDEQGKHAELLAAGGTYARLYSAQFRGAQPETF